MSKPTHAMFESFRLRLQNTRDVAGIFGARSRDRKSSIGKRSWGCDSRLVGSALTWSRIGIMVSIVILRAGDPPPSVAERRGTFFDFITRSAGGRAGVSWSEHDVRTDAPLPSLHAADGFVMTGSSSSVTERAPWMLRAEAWLRDLHAAERPFFGICFGHQMLAQALGGVVAKNPRGREIGTIRVDLHHGAEHDPVFVGLPRTAVVNATHQDSVTALPPGARLLASSDKEPHAAFAIGEHIRCVQFHPEFDGEIMKGYVRARAHLLAQEGFDADAIHDDAKDTEHGPAMLKNWVDALARRGR